MSSLPSGTSIKYEEGRLYFIDQRYLPGKLKIVETSDWRRVERAIKTLAIRGAPLIGIAAAYGVVLSAIGATKGTRGRTSIFKTIERLEATRPTAVNLFHALHRMKIVLEKSTGTDRVDLLLREASLIHEEDRAMCQKIGEAGLEVVEGKSVFLTICNTGFLATGGIGTALGVIRLAHERGLVEHVYALETRPLLQGARLTAWELKQLGIPFTLIGDSAVTALLQTRKVDLAIIGADRITRNGDTANKIGSAMLAVICRHFCVPFFVAAPATTIDADTPTGREIVIEQRDAGELTTFAGKRIAPEGVRVFNPAFDVIDHTFIRSFITDRGVVTPPFISQ